MKAHLYVLEPRASAQGRPDLGLLELEHRTDERTAERTAQQVLQQQSQLTSLGWLGCIQMLG